MSNSERPQVTLVLLGEESGHSETWERIERLAARDGLELQEDGSASPGRTYCGDMQRIGHFLFQLAEKIGSDKFEYTASGI